MNKRLLRRKEVTEYTGIPYSSLYARMDQGLFPTPIKLGPRAVAWVLSEVDEVIDALIAGISDEELDILVDSIHDRRTS